MRNYIEVVHKYVEPNGTVNHDVYWAVKPTSDRWSYRGEEPLREFMGVPWRIMPGETVDVWDRETIVGLRKLLDAIENELKLEGKAE